MNVFRAEELFFAAVNMRLAFISPAAGEQKQTSLAQTQTQPTPALPPAEPKLAPTSFSAPPPSSPAQTVMPAQTQNVQAPVPVEPHPSPEAQVPPSLPSPTVTSEAQPARTQSTVTPAVAQPPPQSLPQGLPFAPAQNQAQPVTHLQTPPKGQTIQPTQVQTAVPQQVQIQPHPSVQIQTQQSQVPTSVPALPPASTVSQVTVPPPRPQLQIQSPQTKVITVPQLQQQVQVFSQLPSHMVAQIQAQQSGLPQQIKLQLPIQIQQASAVQTHQIQNVVTVQASVQEQLQRVQQLREQQQKKKQQHIEIKREHSLQASNQSDIIQKQVKCFKGTAKLRFSVGISLHLPESK